MTILRVDTEVMASAAGRIERALGEIEALMGRLHGDVADLLSAWSGPAATAHRAMHERFDHDAATIATSLSEMHAALVRTHATYVQQETEQSSDHVVLSDQILS